MPLVWTAPAIASGNFYDAYLRYGCGLVSGLFTRRGSTAGPDGFRETGLKSIDRYEA
jgi:hypothetical protein